MTEGLNHSINQSVGKMAHFNYLPEDIQQELRETAEALVAPGKGIFAADESGEQVGEGKFGSVNPPVKNTLEKRREYRQMFFAAGPELAKHISGVIFHHETFSQLADDGTRFVDLVRKQGIIAGIKVDEGAVPLQGTEGPELTTQGLDNLGARCAAYYKGGARFAKWRCPLKISGHTGPSELAIQDMANLLARYASICQANRLVPIVEPDIVPDGSHDLLRCQQVTEQVLAALYKKLSDHHVYLEGTLLKPNMVTPGAQCKVSVTAEEVAKATVMALQRTLPVAVPGVVFLSGGQSEEDATRRLNAINAYPGKKPWKLSFSFGRALQTSAVKAWAGSNVAAGSAEFLKRAKANGLACQAQYRDGLVSGLAAGKSTHVDNHQY